ncbi:CrcB family protein [Paenibacillus chondroitinus]|uniref:Fluoride-specific ion channel FluC n=1 Tax=Paenibacillus chondroitinus TaxID=59842 RepID=A0ABU6DNY4_9BACL|nr:MULTISPECIES: CrcB family protein [Paenibacillus]MCY9660569.1 CrcB family protein [Paenibacillus anseongense]MEB4799329.1 CrcB family protein [Paenibacillus chondroitinus]
MISLVWVALGGFLGACTRFIISTWGNKKFHPILPRVTLFINVSGSFLLGLLVGGAWNENLYTFLGTGFMGAYTTFSTFNMENVQLIKKREWKVLFVYVVGSYGLGILFAGIGFYGGTWMKG